jgi:glutathione peroxidase
MNVYDFSARTISGQDKALADFRSSVLLIVNTASRCGFTPQYKALQELYEKYRLRGFAVLGFPCNQFLFQEPGTAGEIQSFCERNFGVTFPLFEKIDVNGTAAHPLFQYLTTAAPGLFFSKAIKWNFTKFLIDTQGNAVQRFAPMTSPQKIEAAIEALLHAAKQASG